MKKFICVLACFLFIPFTACKSESVTFSTYEITAKLNEDMVVDCNMVYAFRNDSENLSAKYFTLYPNAFSYGAETLTVFESDKNLAYPNGESYGFIDILKIKSQNAHLPYELSNDNQTLKVGFEKPIKRNEEIKIYMEFKVTLPNANHRFGYGENTVNLTGFYPIACVCENGKYYENRYYPAGDPFYSEVSNYKVNLTVPSTYTVASSMSAVKTEWSGEYTKYFYERDKVRDIAFIVSKEFNVVEKNEFGVNVKYYYFQDQTPLKTLETATNSLKFFSDTYYKYPYKEYVVSQANFLYGGMEYPCLSLISNELSLAERDYTVAHETAHQWFYGIVGFNQNEIGFLDEGLTEFSTALYLSEQKNAEKSYQKYLEEAKKSYLSIRRALVYLGNTLPPVMDRHLKEYSSNLEYVMIAYNRGFIMVDEIKKVLGDKKFYKFLNGFISKNAYKNVTSKDFENALEKSSGKAKLTFLSFISGEAVIKE